MKYVYPAIFHKDDSGRYSVLFPDLESCYTCGDDLGDALYMAEDVLAMTLVSYEDKGNPIPEPSKTIPLEAGEFQNFIACDTDIYRNNGVKS